MDEQTPPDLWKTVVAQQRELARKDKRIAYLEAMLDGVSRLAAIAATERTNQTPD